MLEQDISEKRKERHHITQEDFTPKHIVELLCENADDLFTNFSKTFLDPCAGIGNILLYVIEERLKHCNNDNDVINAISTCYGTELMEDNTDECRNRLYLLFKDFCDKQNLTEEQFNSANSKCNEILKHNIVCIDTFKWDYEKWKPLELEKKQLPLF